MVLPKKLIFTLPSTVEIIGCENDRKLISSQQFNVGQIIYSAEAYFIPDENREYIITILDSKNNMYNYKINTIHTVKISEQSRLLYTWDSFINHSCDENIDFINMHETDDGNVCFDAVAVKKIEVGDELSCNYLYFDYTCDGHQFNCKCGSEYCYEFINGFKNLPFTTKIKLINKIHGLMLKYYSQDDIEELNKLL